MSPSGPPNPFVGPRPIQQGEALHGRKTEVRELYEQLTGHRIVVLHSPSGAGKSSLVHAGLIPRLREAKFDVWRPIRVNLEPSTFEGVPEDVNRYVLSALVSLEDELPAEHRRSPAQLAELGLLEYLDGRPRRKGRADQSVVLLFDQFEEILSIAPRAIEAKRAFFAAVGQALDTGRYWALFIVREDYLAALAPYRDLVPTQLSNTHRLDLLGLHGAREAAIKLAQEGGRSFPGVDRLVRDLSAVRVQQLDGSFVVEQGLHVEPVYLQVVCRRLWAALPEDATTIDEASVEAHAEVSRSLAGYYADAVAEIAGDDVALERAIRDFVGTRLIVGGIRSQVRQQSGGDAGVAAVHIERLLDSYLIRSEQRAGANWYELSHDRLVEPVLQDNEAWQQSHLHPVQVQAKLWEDGGRSPALLLDPGAVPGASAWAAANPKRLTAGEREFLRLSGERRERERRSRRGRRLFMVALSTVAVVAVGFGVVALEASEQSELRLHEAEAARERAVTAQQQAEQSQREAEQSEAEATQAKSQAEQSETQARKAHKENERSVRQMFEVGLRPVVERLIDGRKDVGVVDVDERWTPLLERNERVLVAASMGAMVRVVVAGHDAVLAADADGRSLFLEITAQWLLADQARRTIAIVPASRGRRAPLGALQRILIALEHEVVLAPPLAEPDALTAVGMVILDDPDGLRPDELAALERFVERGGGLLAIGRGRAWLAGRRSVAGGPAPTLADYPLNLVLGRHGARFVETTVAPAELERRAVKAIVRFENTLAFDVDLYTREGGHEEYYTTLAAAGARELLTALGREWVFRANADARRIGAAVIEDEDEVVAIGTTVATKKNKPVAKAVPTPVASQPESTRKAPAQLPAALSSEDVQAGLVSAKKAAKQCGKQLATLMADATVKLRVGADGKVIAVSVLPPAKGSPEAACIETELSKLSFPRTQQGGEAQWKLGLY